MLNLISFNDYIFDIESQVVSYPRIGCFLSPNQVFFHHPFHINHELNELHLEYLIEILSDFINHILILA